MTEGIAVTPAEVAEWQRTSRTVEAGVRAVIIPTWQVSCDHDDGRLCDEFFEVFPGEKRAELIRQARDYGWKIGRSEHLCPRHARGVTS